jgi:hypothetical protein
MAIDGNRVYTYKTFNTNAAISINAELVRNVLPYEPNGTNLTAGLWDAGAALATHQEFDERITVIDGAAAHDHATHVGGTIAAAGIVAASEGMAPRVQLDSYEWNNDLGEIASRAMSYPNEPGTIQASNHSYGTVAGWEYSYDPPRWYGDWGNRESELFGQYDVDVATLDEIAYDAPYYLNIQSVGNDRNDDAPAPGEQFQYYVSWPPSKAGWNTKTYDPLIDPCDDGWDNGGFDSLMPSGCAKNILTVGAVNDAVTAGQRDPSKATITAYSSWGPTDDGRIKPDLVANGSGVYSAIATSDTSYAYYNGTSMAAPGATGAAVLLIDLYGRLLPGQAMRASTIKALMIHTADDLGPPGPDYNYGWGLINVKAAADQIEDYFEFDDANLIVETVLDDLDTVHTYDFEWDPLHMICATLCWTDPEGGVVSGLDNSSPRLVNDLDLRIIDPNGMVYHPFVLDPSDPATAAVTGDNFRDNVEQVLIENPVVSGFYTVEVSYKNTLTNGSQDYSLIITGQRTRPHVPGDFNNDGAADILDTAIFFDYWLTGEPVADIYPETADGTVNFEDYAVMAGYLP